VAAEGNVLHDIDSDDEELQRALHASREEAQRERVARQRGGQYEHDGGSSQKQGGGLLGRFTRSSSRRAQTTQTQTRIDKGLWSMKGKQAKTTIGKAWAKFFHTEAILGVKADNPYFVVTVKETQRWGNQVFLLLCTHFFYVNEFDILISLQVRVSPFPSGGK
jgi:hypothetical protein